MDLAMVRANLAMAERHVALGERHIARQIEIIDELTRRGQPADLAIDLLATYRLVQATHVGHRDLELETLRKAGINPPSPAACP